MELHQPVVAQSVIRSSTLRLGRRRQSSKFGSEWTHYPKFATLASFAAAEY